MKAIVIKLLNRRLGAPSVNAPKLSPLEAGTSIEIAQTVIGDKIDGNNVWYKTTEGWYVWSGGVSNIENNYNEKKQIKLTNMLLKLGSKDELVKTLQQFLGIPVTGEFDIITEQAVREYQEANGLKVDGEVGPNTWKSMAIATTDSSERVKNISPELDFNINYLPAGEYMAGPTKKEWLFLHHTAGWENPYDVISGWRADTRGPVATEFVIGGQRIRNNTSAWDGEVVQAFPDGGYGWHLGIGNNLMHRNSVGIEVCSFGQLTMDGFFKNINGTKTWVPMQSGKYYTYVGGEVDPTQVIKLAKPFRGYTYYHKYSDKQIAVLKELILYIANRDSIDVRKGLPELIKTKGADAFDFYNIPQVTATKGLWCHTNVSTEKVDMFPQPELITMLLSL